MNFSLIPTRDLVINGLDRWTNGQESHPIRIPFLPYQVWSSKKDKYNIVKYNLHIPNLKIIHIIDGLCI